MSQNKPTEVGKGLAALLGQPVVAHEAPEVIPEPTVEDDDAREVRLAKAMEALQALAPEPELDINYEAIKANVDIKQQEYLEAEAILRQAEKTFQRRAAALDEARREELRHNPKSEQELNAEYIQAQIAERARKAADEQLRYEIARKSGLFSEQQLAQMCPQVSPLTAMIQNQKNIEKRAQSLAGRR